RLEHFLIALERHKSEDLRRPDMLDQLNEVIYWIKRERKQIDTAEITIELSATHQRTIRHYCEEHAMNFNDFCIMAIEKGLEREKQKNLAHVGLQVKLADCVEREGLGEGCALPKTPPLHLRTHMSQYFLPFGGQDQSRVCRFCPNGGKKRHTLKIKYHAAAGESAESDVLKKVKYHADAGYNHF